MYYICVEDERVISVLDYEPNVPDTVQVVEISAEDFAKLDSKTHYFDIPTSTVIQYGAEYNNQRQQLQLNQTNEKFLASTDWKVMRHIREKALGIPTSLSESAYLDLELTRQRAADDIKY